MQLFGLGSCTNITARDSIPMTLAADSVPIFPDRDLILISLAENPVPVLVA